MFCKNCGTKLNDTASFCSNCGTRVTAAGVNTFTGKSGDETVKLYDDPTVFDPAHNTYSGASSEAQNRQKFHDTSNGYSGVNWSQNPQPDARQTTAKHNGSVSFSEAIKLYFVNYANFSGRASKSEYWWSYLFNFLVLVVFATISRIIPAASLALQMIYQLYSLAVIVPGISIVVRRLHDIGKSGKYYFILFIPIVGSIIMIVWLCRGSVSTNEWGPGPDGAPVPAHSPNLNNSVSFGAPINAVNDNTIFAMAQNHEPLDVNHPVSIALMDSKLKSIAPSYMPGTDLSSALMLTSPATVKRAVLLLDTDSLFVVLKAIGVHIARGEDVNVLTLVQKDIVDTLKVRVKM